MDAHARLREDESRLHGTLEHPITVHQIPRLLYRPRQRVENPPRSPQSDGPFLFAGVLRVQCLDAMREGVDARRGRQIRRRIEGQLGIVQRKSRADRIASDHALATAFPIRRPEDRRDLRSRVRRWHHGDETGGPPNGTARLVETERRGLGRADGAATAESHERVRLPGARLPRDFLRGRFGYMRSGPRIGPYESVTEGFADSSANRSTREVSSRHQIRARRPEFAEKWPQIPDGSRTQDDERLSLLPPDPWHGLRGLGQRPRPLRDRPRLGTIRSEDGPRQAIRPLLAPPAGATRGTSTVL